MCLSVLSHLAFVIFFVALSPSQICEETRHDTYFEIRAQYETYYGSMEWADCVIADDYEDRVWSKKQMRGYLDLIKANNVVSVQTATEDPTDAPTSNPTLVPISSPVVATGNPAASGETSAGTLVEKEEIMCDQLSLSIGCSTRDGVDCNDVTFPTGTESDPCNKNVQYVYMVSNVGNTGNADFSKLMRTRIGADSEDLDFLPFFGDEGLVLGQAYIAGAASMTESTSVNFCQPLQKQVTVLVVESETERGGTCNATEEYLLITPIEAPLDLSGDAVDAIINTEEDGFDTFLDSSEVSKENVEGMVTVQVIPQSSTIVGTSTASAGSLLFTVSLACASFLLAILI